MVVDEDQRHLGRQHAIRFAESPQRLEPVLAGEAARQQSAVLELGHAAHRSVHGRLEFGNRIFRNGDIERGGGVFISLSAGTDMLR